MELLKRKLLALGVIDGAVDMDACLKMFERYLELLLEWNKRINLTAICTPEEIIDKHFVDSATLLGVTGFETGASVLDIGTGAGFPGVPLKLLRPDIDLTLLDSLNKRILFLKELISSLGLERVAAVAARAEDAAHNPAYRECFDIVCARAVARLPVLAEYGVPFVKIGGKFISMKGFDAKDEILASEKAVSSMGARIESVINLNIPDTDIRRSVIIIRKIGHTPPDFPRKPGRIKKNPI